MAHQEGILKRLPRYVVAVRGPGSCLASASGGPGHDVRQGYDLDDIPLAQALWSFGFVVLLLHYSPSWPQWPPRLAAGTG